MCMDAFALAGKLRPSFHQRHKHKRNQNWLMSAYAYPYAYAASEKQA